MTPQEIVVEFGGATGKCNPKVPVAGMMILSSGVATHSKPLRMLNPLRMSVSEIVPTVVHMPLNVKP